MKLKKLWILLLFPLIWAFSLVHFWCFMAPDGGMAYTTLYYFILFPITIFGTSFYIGRKDLFGRRNWLFCGLYGIMTMVSFYCTFPLAHDLASEKVDAPDIGPLLIGGVILAFISALGLMFGMVKKGGYARR